MKPPCPRPLFRSRRPDPDPPPHLACVAELLRRHGHQLRQGAPHAIEIIHEADCPLPRGRGSCTCTTIEARLVEPIDPGQN